MSAVKTTIKQTADGIDNVTIPLVIGSGIIGTSGLVAIMAEVGSGLINASPDASIVINSAVIINAGSVTAGAYVAATAATLIMIAKKPRNASDSADNSMQDIQKTTQQRRTGLICAFVIACGISAGVSVNNFLSTPANQSNTATTISQEHTLSVK